MLGTSKHKSQDKHKTILYNDCPIKHQSLLTRERKICINTILYVISTHIRQTLNNIGHNLKYMIFNLSVNREMRKKFYFNIFKKYKKISYL